MKSKYLQQYAKLIAKIGVNVQKDQEVLLVSNVEAVKLARLVVNECYALGAKKVRIQWTDDLATHTVYQNESAESVKDYLKYVAEERIELVAKKKACYIRILSDIPGLFSDVAPEKMSAITTYNRALLKPVIKRVIDSTVQWTIAGYPNIEWAKIVFPDLKPKLALKKLTRAILDTCRIKKNQDAIQNWELHNRNLHEICAHLNKYQFTNLHFVNSLGTDLNVGLVDNHIWLGGKEEGMGVPEYNPNLPSEEVFCMPHKYHVNGTVVSTKPLNYNGQLINNFKLTFKDGEIVKHEAQQGGDVLKKIIDTDAGSKRIGEVALVSYNSPISNSGVLFFETLYDENASCHLAIGSSYPINVVKGTKMSKHKKDKVGANTSALHIDFMFGSKDMNCVGTTKSGQKVQIMKDGEIDLKSISTTEKAIKD